MLAPLRAYADQWREMPDWPERETLQSMLSARGATAGDGRALTLVEPSGDAYEKQLYLTGELQFRERSWHDLFNVCAWMLWPRAKRALNRRHYLASAEEGAPRGPVRDALTLFDESGAIVVCSDPTLLDAVRRFEWKALFWARRAELAERSRVHLFGHALMEKALAPYVGLTAHALLLEAPPGSARDTLDELVARRLGDAEMFAQPQMLAPLPVLGVPGWWPGNEHEAFYEDTRYFRRGRRKSGGDD